MDESACLVLVDAASIINVYETLGSVGRRLIWGMQQPICMHVSGSFLSGQVQIPTVKRAWLKWF